MTQLGELVQVATGLASLDMAQPRGPRFKSGWVFLPADVVIGELDRFRLKGKYEF